MRTPVLPAVTAGLVLLFLAVPANAALITRSYVASNGNDANDCKLPTPCRTFAGAYLKTTAGGEIDVLDSDGYGALTINHALSIVNNGTGNAAMIPAVNGVGITIAAGPSDAIMLRGLTIDGQGNSNSTGIKFTTGGALTIQDCVVRHVTNNGIDFEPSGSSTLSISDSVADDNGGQGIYIAPSGSGSAKAVLSGIEANGNNDGVDTDGSSTSGRTDIALADSVVANNSHAGLAAESTSGTVLLTAMRATVTGNEHGLIATGSVGGIILIGQSNVSSNEFGWDIEGGWAVYSFITNQINFNGGSLGLLTPTVLQ